VCTANKNIKTRETINLIKQVYKIKKIKLKKKKKLVKQTKCIDFTQLFACNSIFNIWETIKKWRISFSRIEE
jgi:hypothetical protein